MSSVQSPSLIASPDNASSPHVHWKSLPFVILIAIGMWVLKVLLDAIKRPRRGGYYGSIISRSRTRHLIYSLSPSATLPRQNEGLDPAAIAKIPTLIYKTAGVSDLAGGSASGSLALECAVCLGEFQDNQTLRVLSSCKHTFHMECIDMWLASHPTCPLCRTPLVFPSSLPNVDPKVQDVRISVEVLQTTGASREVASSSTEPYSMCNQFVRTQEPTSSTPPSATCHWRGEHDEEFSLHNATEQLPCPLRCPCSKFRVPPDVSHIL